VVAKPEPAPEKIDHEPPVSAAAQRAFDEARRAMRAGRHADAERAFKALTVSHPELGGPHANLGLIYRQAGKTADSVAEFEKAILASPRQPIFHNQLGIAYRLNGQFTKAREAYEKAIDLDAGYAAPHLNLGILHDLYLWDGKRALELYDRYLALSPGGDTTVVKWVADLKNRKPQHAMLTRKEKE
jgi:Flp pilus assembly protein TadD